MKRKSTRIPNIPKKKQKIQKSKPQIEETIFLDFGCLEYIFTALCEPLLKEKRESFQIFPAYVFDVICFGLVSKLHHEVFQKTLLLFQIGETKISIPFTSQVIIKYWKASDFLFQLQISRNKTRHISFSYNDINVVLCKAIKEKNYLVISMLLNAGANINSVLDCGLTPLYFAIETGDLTLIKEIVSKGAYVNVPKTQKDLNCPLVLAGQTSNFEVIDYLIDNGADVHQKCSNGNLITSVIKYCTLDYLKKLISLNINPNIKDNYNQSPLLISCGLDNLEKAEYLIEIGADPNLTNLDGKSPLFQLCMGELNSKKYNLIQNLLENGSNINSKLNHSNLTPLFAFTYMRPRKPDFKLIDYLIDKGANIHQETTNGNLITSVIKYCTLDYLKKLISLNINPNIKDNYNQSPLLISCGLDNLEKAEYLISIDDVDCELEEDKYLNPFLQLCKIDTSEDTELQNQKMKLVRILVQKGTNINSQISNLRKNAFLFAAKKNDKELLNFLLSQKNINLDLLNNFGFDKTYCISPNVLMIAIDNQWVSIVKKLCNLGVNLDLIWQDKNPLILSKNYEITKILIENGANINLKVYLKNPLSTCDSTKIAKLLVENGCQINNDCFNYAVHSRNPNLMKFYHKTLPNSFKDEFNSNLIYCCSNFDHFKSFKLLLKWGADPNQTLCLFETAKLKNFKFFKYLSNLNNINLETVNSQGENILMFSSRIGLQYVKLICEKNRININEELNRGKNALLIACENNMVDIIIYLVSKNAIIDKNSKYFITVSRRACMKKWKKVSNFLENDQI